MRRATWRRPSPWALVPAALILALAGCVAPAPSPPPQATMPPPTAEALPKPPPRKPPTPSTAAVTPSAAPATPVEAAPVEAPAPPPPQVAVIEPPPTLPPPATMAPRPTRLIGLNQPEVAQLLGEPKSRAEAPPATIWRYDGNDCALDVYFYLDLQSQAMRALHYEVRSHDAAERSAQRCYETLLAERRATADPAGGTDHPR